MEQNKNEKNYHYEGKGECDMDLLQYGMENAESKSTVKRSLAQAALAVEKKKADMYEKYLERMPISIPEEDSERMLQKIREEIESQKD